ncbi:hypothetical protein WL05_29375 [Burkholderia ubonensis]|uniref:DUF2625 domain-containing protein n=1 Tax=Burkholderia ubonensis TaxID=101571 RepID=UPI0007548AA6|nr:DUF2625 domain-containing protein [Burkholderia ubonensis]KVM17057.1 hypothetical protein WJ52_13300 [Burkholderia ubonensis]KVM18755.1 hypothetical protein WJ51_06785 [Burkholderia ubonensis]KVM42309.1 hypothetical protein WJ56_31005 [Burkholderia ubonensis]KVX62397.1 hypothetical protein WL05_29375 [Burkholderia ubonensis]KVZ12647.1 hypothetical protein WL11_32385 [Burkholderia ubonensis]
MRPLNELVNERESALPSIMEWAAAATHPCEILPPAKRSSEVLLALQITTRSPLGAIAYSTGGILVDSGYLRLLGSGHPRLTRNIVDWNEGRSAGFLLVADDVVGGFFALNGGALGEDVGSMYYFAPDNLQWEPLEIGYGDFLRWSFTDRLHDFYSTMRWPGWQSDVQNLGPDECFNFYPFLWTKEGSVQHSSRKAVSVSELYSLHIDSESVRSRRA